MKIFETGPEGYSIIHTIAKKTWGATYKDILSKEQLDYMFVMMYSNESLLEQMKEKGHRFIIVEDGGEPFGFASFEHGLAGKTKIHKLYVIPGLQKKGTGTQLLTAIEKFTIEAGDTAICLNVNRFNPALNFYLKTGFTIAGEEDIEIGRGYLMEDYIMEKAI